MRHGEVGDGRFAEQEIAVLARQLALQSRHECRPLVARLFQRQAAGAAAAEQLAAIGHEGLEEFRRQLAETHGDGLRGERQAYRVLEQHRVGPLGEARGDHLLAFGEQRRDRLFLLQATGDQRGIAIHIGADLQHRGLPIAAGQRHQVRLGHHRRNHHRAPGQLLETEQQARLLGEGRSGIVMQDQL